MVQELLGSSPSYVIIKRLFECLAYYPLVDDNISSMCSVLEPDSELESPEALETITQAKIVVSEEGSKSSRDPASHIVLNQHQTLVCFLSSPILALSCPTYSDAVFDIIGQKDDIFTFHWIRMARTVLHIKISSMKRPSLKSATMDSSQADLKTQPG